MCGADSSGCTQLCTQITREAQIRCLEASTCDEDAARDCLTANDKPDGSVPDSSTNPPPSTPNKPSELTISGSFGQVQAHHVLNSAKTQVASLVTMGPKPEFSPSTPSELPDIAHATRVEVSSPTIGTCAGRFSWSLNSGQLGLTFTGTDTLPNTDCVKFTDDFVANGMDAVVPDAKYYSGGTVRITLKLRP